MTETARNFLIGLTTLAALVGLAYLLYRFGELEAMVNPRYDITINATHAAGLRQGSTIELNGVPVGVVSHLTTGQGTQYPVHITAEIDQSQQIPAEVVLYAATSLLGGSATLQLEAPRTETGEPPQFLPTDGSAEINRKILSRLIEQITDELDSQMAPLIEAVEMAKSWLGDEQLRADTHQAVRKVSELIDRAGDTLENFSQVAAGLEADVAQVTKGLLPVLDELATTLEEIRQLTRLARQGEGTIGQLLNNPDLYRSLTDAVTRLDRVLSEVQLLTQEIRTEGLTLKR
ncbi:MAG: MlaD family protein [Phycisphaerales bacterium]|nr:MlaD family protein [Planctomycetota bacterium]MCZ6811232.1 MlaD family protein [Planctomycetota bacterium]